MKAIYLFILHITLFTPAFVMAQAGNPDPDFSSNGLVTTSFYSAKHTAANSVLIQKDDKILVSGYSGVPGNLDRAVLVRYHPDGTLDNTYNGNGKIMISYPGNHSYMISSIQLPDERILSLVSLDNNSNDSIALYCFHPNGSLDPAFNTDGMATLNLGTAYQEPTSLALQYDGKIVIGGYVGRQDEDFDKFFVVRFMPNGTPDITFGDDGVTITEVGEGYTNIGSILIQPDGKIIAAGNGIFNDLEKFAVARYEVNGALDNSFGEEGIAIASFSNSNARATGAVLQPDGKIVLGGYATAIGGNHDFAVARFTTEGSLDNSFHGDGLTTIEVTTFADYARAILLQPDGKIVLGGLTHSNMEGGSNMSLVRLTVNGIPDYTFDNDGIVEFAAVSVNSDEIYSIAMQDDGKIVAAGYARNGDYNEIAVARFLSGLTVSTHEVAIPIKAISLYPNPANAQITIEYELSLNTTVAFHLLDLQGRIVQTLLTSVPEGPGKHIETLEISRPLPAGSYLISLSTEEGMKAVRVIID